MKIWDNATGPILIPIEKVFPSKRKSFSTYTKFMKSDPATTWYIEPLRAYKIRDIYVVVGVYDSDRLFACRDLGYKDILLVYFEPKII